MRYVGTWWKSYGLIVELQGRTWEVEPQGYGDQYDIYASGDQFLAFGPEEEPVGVFLWPLEEENE